MPAPQYVIYTTSSCAACDAAKAHLKGLQIPFEERNMSEPENRSFINEGMRDVPQVWRTDGDAPIFIGGLSDLKAYLKVSL